MTPSDLDATLAEVPDVSLSKHTFFCYIALTPQKSSLPLHDYFSCVLSENVTIAPLPNLTKANWSSWKASVAELANVSSTIRVFCVDLVEVFALAAFHQIACKGAIRSGKSIPLKSVARVQLD